MGYESRISTKGQLVVPKELRDRHGWKAGSRIEFVDRGGVIALRVIPEMRSDAPTTDEVFARLAALNPYRGPRISDGEMNDIVQAAAVARYEKSF